VSVDSGGIDLEFYLGFEVIFVGFDGWLEVTCSKSFLAISMSLLAF
jgi:hypothetical protein